MSKVSTFLDLLEPVIENIEKLTPARRIAIWCATFVVLIGLFVWLSFLPKMGTIEELEGELQTTKTKLATAQRNANQLTMYRNKMIAAEAEFEIAKRKLPEKQEIPSLLTSISRSGQDAGLDFLLFQPRPEAAREFYAEIPLSIRVTGNYHAVGVFFDKVAKLSRIVNIKDIRMVTQKRGESLETTCTAVTYKFVEPQPAAE